MEVRTLQSSRLQRRLAVKSLQAIYKLAMEVSVSRVESQLSQFKARFRDLEKLRTDFENAHMFVASIGDEKADSTKLDAEYDEFFQTFYSVQVIHSDICAAVTESVVDNKNSAPVKAQTKFQLPKIELTRYSGVFTEWTNFISVFNSLVHNNDCLNGVQKMHYLFSTLDGEPLNLVRHLPICEDNYTVAYQLLTDRYENKRLIADMHLDAILSLQNFSELNQNCLRKFVNTLKENTQALNALKFSVDSWSFILLHIISRKLPTSLRSRFELDHDSSHIPTFSELLLFLENQLRVLENVSAIVKPSSSGNKGRPGGVSKCFTSTSEVCPCCGSNHPVYHCDKFNAMTPEQRKACVMEQKLCFNCLRPHPVAKCNSKFSCQVCRGRHHTKIHIPTSSSSNLTCDPTCEGEAAVSTFSSTVQPHTFSSVHANSTVLLATALVKIRDIDGQYHCVRALLDSGSQVTVMTENIAQKLRLRRSSSGTIIGLGSASALRTNGSVLCTIKPCLVGPQLTFTTNALILKRVVNNMPSVHVATRVHEACRNITLADPKFAISSPIDLLIGADLYDQIFDGRRLKLGDGMPTAYSTVFGWVLLGRAPTTSPLIEPVTSLACTLNIDLALNKFWESEEPPHSKIQDPENVQCEKHFVETHSRDETGRFVVRLPFKSGRKQLGGTHAIALKRFHLLERKLARDPKLKDLYVAFMRDYLDAGHMRAVSSREGVDRYHIPHHGVLKESSSTTKLRAVFDASMPSTSGISLNHILIPGPKLQQNVEDIILRFRVHAVVFTSDVKQMYRQVRMHAEDKYQTIFWRESSDSPVQQYELTTVTYGVSSAAYLAMRVIHELAVINEHEHPAASRVLKEDIFVDDIVSGSNSVESAKHLQDEVVAVLRQGRFQLRKWSSNHPKLLDHLPPDHCETPLRFEEAGDNIYKILGLEWSARSDQFLYQVSKIGNANTKRGILSNIARLYDPCGYLTPVTFFAKAFMQSLWLLDLSWDEAIPTELLQKWNAFVVNFQALNRVRINRRILSEHPEGCELHGFSDASERGYAAVVYLRVLDAHGEVSVHLVMAKSRVAPLKQKLTIPRLELCGAVLVARLLDHVVKVLSSRMQVGAVTAWCDSSIVLTWLRTPPHKLQTYEANRVSQAQGFLSSDSWRHVPSSLNAADCASRGLYPQELVDHHLWWSPSWLAEPPESWPADCTAVSMENLPGLRVPPVTSMTTVEDFSFVTRFSALYNMQLVLGWCLRFAHNARHPNDKHQGPLSVRELDSALLVAIKMVQNVEFADAISALHSNKQIKGNLLRLNPFLDSQGILRVGGRLTRSSLAYDAKHPMLLPRVHHLTNLIIDHHHQVHLHAGPSALIAILQRRFWILSARRSIRHRIFKCLRCFRLKAKPIEPFMGDLPASRIHQSRPFQRSGADFAGPFTIKASKLRGAKTQKAYLCVFVCFVTRAVHLEVVSDLTTDAFLASFSRMVSRRGLVTDIFTDCGTNFQGARRYLDEVTEFLMNPATQGKLHDTLRKLQVRWHMNPPQAPHMGGLWETAVKSSKLLLKRVIGEQALTFEELTTIFTKIEAVLNSRPLCPVSSDPNDLDVLTPGHFLIGEPLVGLPEYEFDHTPINRLTRWQLTQQISQHFWKRWQAEYLHTLQQRPKWQKGVKGLEVGDLALLKEDNLPPLQWRLGRVTKLCPGEDGVVRVVELRTSTGTYLRPTVKVCPLPDQQAD